MTQAFQTTNEDILQSIIYAYGVISNRLSAEEFAKYQAVIMNAVNHLLSRQLNDINSLTYDNAISSFGKVVLKQMVNSPDFATLVVKYLSLLPLKNDLEESEKVTFTLLRDLEKGNPLLTQEGVLPAAKEAIKRINTFRVEEGEILEDEGVALMMLVTNKYQI